MTDRSENGQQGNTPQGQGWAHMATAALVTGAGLVVIASWTRAGALDASWLWILGVILGAVALVLVPALILVLVGAVRAQKKRLADLVAMVARKRPDAVIVPGVVESGVVSFPPNRPKFPGHVALAILADRVELWNWFSTEPHASVERVPGGISVEPIAATSWNGRRTTIIDHLVCRDDELELFIVPEYEIHRRADYPAGMERALRELGLQQPDV